MAYSDKTYFQKYISTADYNLLVNSTDTNLTNAVADADSLIDSYLRAIVDVPLSPVPEIIKRCSYDIATFYLHDRIQFDDVPERVRDKYDAAINFLKDLASGKATLNLPAETTNTAEENIETDGNDLQMSRDMF